MSGENFRENIGILPEFEHVSSVGARFLLYKRGCIVRFRAPAGDVPTRGDSKVILDQSSASRHRAAFAFGNAECDWLAMTTLTYHSTPSRSDVVLHLERLARDFRARWGEPICGWIKEFQKRGTPHFHLFHARESAVGIAISAGTEDIREDDGRRVSRGNFDYWIRETWLKISGQKSDSEAVWWHSRGIVEFFDSPDAAGRYVAKEAAKREQKILPPGFEDGIGRWWNLARRWKPIPIGCGDLDLHEWPWEHPISTVWNGETLAVCMQSFSKAPTSNLKGWLQLQGFLPVSEDLFE